MNSIRKLIPNWLKNIYHFKMAVLANIYYGFPGKKMRVIGITGTNGKTTTAMLLASILKESGKKVGMLTTVRFTIGDKEIANKLNMTTVKPFLLQKYLKTMLKEGCTDIVLEVTSHAVAQHRVWGINFNTIALTNITHDHLDYHQTFENYKNAKKRLFLLPHNVTVLNKDDDSFAEFSKASVSKVIAYSTERGDADVASRKVLTEPNGTDFTLLTSSGQIAVSLNLPGKFNVSNALCASSVAEGLKLPLTIVKNGLEAVLQVPGRMEKVTIPEAKGRLNFSVIIDYAHTPDALEKAIMAIRPATKGKLIAVYGATGDRDKLKRPVLGEIGGRLADIVIITDEEPYGEDPMVIINEVSAGVEKGATKERPKKLNETFFVIENRLEAIEKAVKLAGSGDVVLVTGMGDQSYKVINGHKYPWSDREAVQAVLRQRLMRG